MSATKATSARKAPPSHSEEKCLVVEIYQVLVSQGRRPISPTGRFIEGLFDRLTIHRIGHWLTHHFLSLNTLKGRYLAIGNGRSICRTPSNWLLMVHYIEIQLLEYIVLAISDRLVKFGG